MCLEFFASVVRMLSISLFYHQAPAGNKKTGAGCEIQFRKKKNHAWTKVPAWIKAIYAAEILLGALLGLLTVDQIVNIGRIRTLGANLSRQHICIPPFGLKMYLDEGDHHPSFLV